MPPELLAITPPTQAMSVRRRIGPELAAVAGQQAVDVAERRSRAATRTRAPSSSTVDAAASGGARRPGSPSVWRLAVEARAAGAEHERRRRRSRASASSADDVVDVARHRRPPAGSAGTGWRPRRSGRGRARACSTRSAPSAATSSRSQRLGRAAARPSRARSTPARLGRRGSRRAPSAAAASRSDQPHPGGDPDLRRAAARPAPRSPRAAPSVSSSRLVDVARRARRSRAATAATSSAGRSSPGAPATCSSVGEPLEDHVLLVAQHQERDRHLVGDRGPQRGDPVLRRALAEHADDRPAGCASCTPTAARDPEAEPAAGAEVVAAGPRQAQPVAQRERARRRLEHDDPVRRPGVGERGHRLRAAHRIAGSGGSPGSGAARAASRSDSPTSARRSAASASADVADDRVAHRRARRLGRVAGDRAPATRPRAAAGRGCTGSRGTPTSRRRARRSWPCERLRRPGRSRAAARRRKLRVVLGEADPAAAGARASPTPAGAGARRARRRRPSRRWRRCRGRRSAPGCAAASSRSASVGERVGIGARAADDARARAC